MDEFARIFIVDGEQVLFWHEPDHQSDTEDLTKIHQITVINDITIDWAASFPPDAFQPAWDKFDLAAAQNFRAAAQELLDKHSVEDKSFVNVALQRE